MEVGFQPCSLVAVFGAAEHYVGGFGLELRRMDFGKGRRA
jgi:hypothetical protein